MNALTVSMLVAVLCCFTSGSNSNSSVESIVRKGRIINGQTAESGRFKYAVYIESQIIRNGKRILSTCGAALIDTEWILTTAHCAAQPKVMVVYLGMTIGADATASYVVDIYNNLFIHPDFDGQMNDIALIKISPVELCDTIATVPLPKTKTTGDSFYVSESGIVCGWGYEDDEEPPLRIRWARMGPIMSNEDCLGVSEILRSDMFCIDTSNGVNTGLGDSGGPFILERTGELVGLICRYKVGLPAIFVRVNHFLQWINSITGIPY